MFGACHFPSNACHHPPPCDDSRPTGSGEQDSAVGGTPPTTSPSRPCMPSASKGRTFSEHRAWLAHRLSTCVSSSKRSGEASSLHPGGNPKRSSLPKRGVPADRTYLTVHLACCREPRWTRERPFRLPPAHPQASPGGPQRG